MLQVLSRVLPLSFRKKGISDLTAYGEVEENSRELGAGVPRPTGVQETSLRSPWRTVNARRAR